MKQKQVVKISVFITSIFILFLSITYAFMDMTLAGLKRQVITAGNYELEIDEDENNLTIQNALPMYDEVGMLQDPFTFRLINKDNKGLEYYLKLVDVTNESKEKLDTSIVKYAFTKNGENTIDYLSHIEDEKIDHDFIAPGKTIEYALRMWIDIDVTDESVIQGKNLSYKIAVEVFEDDGLSGMMKPSGIVADSFYPDEVSEESYWPYYKQITSVTFENEIAIPDDAVASWDISVKEDKSVMAYIIEDGTTVYYSVRVLDSSAWFGVSTENRSGPGYKLYIQGKKIYANNSSANSGLFTNFVNLKSIQNLSYLDTSKSTDLSSMFLNCKALSSIDISGFDTSNTINMQSIFSGCSGLTNLDLSNFDTSNVTDMSNMFSNCSSLTSLDLSHFNMSNVTNMSGIFQHCESFTNLDLSEWDTAHVMDMSNMFSNCSGLTSLSLNNLNTANVTSMSYMFLNCSNLETLDVSSFNTSSVISMCGMFNACKKLKNLDLRNFDTSNVTSMSGMFFGCSSLTSINLSSFTTSKVESMFEMFSGCSSLRSLDVSHFDTSNATSMSYMFSNCSSLTSLDLSSFNTSNVTDLSYMFSDCKALKSISLGTFNTSKVTAMNRMFSECNALTSLNLNSFNTLNATTMSSMFENCKNLTTLNFANSNTSNVTDMSDLFAGCIKLTTLNLGIFNTSKLGTGPNDVLGGNFSVFGMYGGNVPYNCRITVKNQASKSAILGLENAYTNITVTG